MRPLLRSWFPALRDAAKTSIQKTNRLRAGYDPLPDADLRSICAKTAELETVLAVTAVMAKRVLGLDMFDVQLRGALALAHGRIAEMQTGEGKTLAAVHRHDVHATALLGVPDDGWDPPPTKSVSTTSATNWRSILPNRFTGPSRRQ